VTKRDSTIAGFWTYLLQGLRSHEKLRAVLKDPSRLYGCVGEKWDHDQPTTAQCPAIRLTATPQPGGWMTLAHSGAIRGDHSFPLAIEIETWVSGSDCTASMELWEGLMSAIFPEDADKRAAWIAGLREYGVNNITIEQAAWGSRPDGGVIRAQGRIRVDMAFLT